MFWKKKKQQYELITDDELKQLERLLEKFNGAVGYRCHVIANYLGDSAFNVGTYDAAGKPIRQVTVFNLHMAIYNLNYQHHDTNQ